MNARALFPDEGATPTEHPMIALAKALARQAARDEYARLQPAARAAKAEISDASTSE